MIRSVGDAHGDAPRVVFSKMVSNIWQSGKMFFKDTSLERDVAAPLMWKQSPWSLVSVLLGFFFDVLSLGLDLDGVSVSLGAVLTATADEFMWVFFLDGGISGREREEMRLLFVGDVSSARLKRNEELMCSRLKYCRAQLAR